MSSEAVFLVANHISWLDIVALGAVVPANFVSKSDIRGWPVFGWMAAAGGTVFIPRGQNQARAVADQVATRLDSGCSVVVFAEGTTSNGRQVRRFYPRLFAAAIEAGAAVQPVAVRFPHAEGVHPAAPFVDDDPFSSSLKRILEAPQIEVELVFCSVVAAAGRDRRGLAVETREAIVRAYGLPEEEA
jgi:1-acyl-sn-glycerol-3-phosphate acyltransferase